MKNLLAWLQDYTGEGIATYGNAVLVVTLLAALGALLYVVLTARKVLRFAEGTTLMTKISQSIREGANAFLKRQYRVVLIFFLSLFVLLLILSIPGFVNPFVPFAFLSGGFFSGLSGFIGMKIATAANARTANACRDSLNRGLKVAFSAGSVMGLTVVGLGLFDITVWYTLLKWVFRLPVAEITGAMVTFGLGASSMALFSRVGGGIFTKAADVGADLVGKVEAGIPEDDPRNPACIADNVGDNVGDVAGMGADLYESYVSSILSASALGVAAFGGSRFGSVGASLTPFLIAAMGIVAAMLGTLFIRTKEDTNQKSLLASLRRGTNFAAIFVAIVSYPVVRFLLGKDNWGFYIAILLGLISGVLIGLCTEFFTSDSYGPTKKLASTAETGCATEIIDGLGLGMLSTAMPVVIVVICLIGSFFLSGRPIGDEPLSAARGLYGIALAAVGMLSTLGITLATDAYGPVADNAGGIAQMSGLEEDVRRRTDALDSLGNTTAATGKGFAIGSAALTAMALIASYIEKVKSVDPEYVFDLGLMNPTVLAGLLLGACLPFVFSAMTMKAVGRAAQSIVLEVRRQFMEKLGIMAGTEKPDYASCVDLCTRSSLKHMVLPALLAVVAPLGIGLVLGVNGVVGMLAGATATGFLLAIFMSNSGGAWDNAKKYIESGNFGGKGSDAHKAAVVGDTIGDPFKDTAGPAINILIKLLSIVSIAFAGLICAISLL